MRWLLHKKADAAATNKSVRSRCTPMQDPFLHHKECLRAQNALMERSSPPGSSRPRECPRSLLSYRLTPGSSPIYIRYAGQDGGGNRQDLEHGDGHYRGGGGGGGGGSGCGGGSCGEEGGQGGKRSRRRCVRSTLQGAKTLTFLPSCVTASRVDLSK